MFAVSARHTMANARPVQVTVPEVEAVKPEKAPRPQPPSIHELLDRRAIKSFAAPLWLREIVTDVAERTGVSAWHIMRNDRRGPTVAARNEVFYLARLHVMPNGKPPSYPKIAAWFRRNHTSIVFGVARHAMDNGLPPLTVMDAGVRIERSRRTARKSGERRP